MKMTLTESDFRNLWPDSRKDQFSREALIAMFEWYEQLETDCDSPEIEFDPIAFCCEWAEYASGQELEEAYDMTLNEIRDNTTVIDLENGYLIQQF